MPSGWGFHVKRYWKQISGATLVAVGVILGVVFQSDSGGIYDVIVPPPEGVVYVDANATDRVNPGGKTVTRTIQNSQNYLAVAEDGTSAWQRTNTVIQPSPISGWDYGVKRAPYRIGFKRNGTVSIWNQGSRYQFQAVRVGYFTPGVADFVPLTAANSPTPTVENCAIVWENYFPAIDQIGIVDGGHYKENFLIKAAARSWLASNPPANPAGDYFTIVFEADWGEVNRTTTTGTINDSEGYEIGFKDTDGNILESFPMTEAYSVNAPDTTIRVRHKLVRKGLKNYILTGVKYADLMALPAGNIILDPTVILQQGVTPAATYTGCEDNYMRGSLHADKNYGTAATALLGDAGGATNIRILIRFNKGFFENVTITSAILGLTCTAESSADDYVIYAYEPLQNWVAGTSNGAAATGETTYNNVNHSYRAWNTAGCSATSDSADQDSTSDRKLTAVGSVAITGVGTFSIDVTASFLRYMAGGVNANNYGWIIVNPDGETNDRTKTISMANTATTANRPTLTVIYTLKSLTKANKLEFGATGNEFLIAPNRVKTYTDGGTKNRVLTAEIGGTASIVESVSAYTITQTSTNVAYFRTTDSQSYNTPCMLGGIISVASVGASGGRVLSVHSVDWDMRTPAAASVADQKIDLYFMADGTVSCQYYGTDAAWHYWKGSTMAWTTTATDRMGTWTAATPYCVYIQNDGTNYIMGFRDAACVDFTGSPATIAQASVNDATSRDYYVLGHECTDALTFTNMTVSSIHMFKAYANGHVNGWATFGIDTGSAVRMDDKLYMKYGTGDAPLLYTPLLAVGDKWYAEAKVYPVTGATRYGMTVVSSDFDFYADTTDEYDGDSKICIDFAGSGDAGFVKLIYINGAGDDFFFTSAGAWQASSAQWGSVPGNNWYTIWIEYDGATFTFGAKNASGVALGPSASIAETSCRDTTKDHYIYLGKLDDGAGSGTFRVDYWTVYYAKALVGINLMGMGF